MPARVPTTARPRQNASTITRPIPSERDGSTSSPRGVHRRGDLGRRQLAVPARTGADERLGDSVRVPLPTSRRRRPREARRREPPRLGEAVDVLVRLQHADEERDWALRESATFSIPLINLFVSLEETTGTISKSTRSCQPNTHFCNSFVVTFH